MGPLRLVSYLSPGLPGELFNAIGSHLGRRLDCRVTVEFVTTASGPPPDASNPLGAADLAIVCAPSYAALRRSGAAVLVPAAPVFDDPRSEGRPVYFSDVVVRAEHPARQISDLTAARWAVNDEQSLSGYGCVVSALGDRISHIWSGGHRRSIDLVRCGQADAAAIDANSLRWVDTTGLRRIHTFGPHPIQPVIAHPRLGDQRVAAVAQALQTITLAEWHITGFAAVSEADYPTELASKDHMLRVAPGTTRNIAG